MLTFDLQDCSETKSVGERGDLERARCQECRRNRSWANPGTAESALNSARPRHTHSRPPPILLRAASRLPLPLVSRCLSSLAASLAPPPVSRRLTSRATSRLPPPLDSCRLSFPASRFPSPISSRCPTSSALTSILSNATLLPLEATAQPRVNASDSAHDTRPRSTRRVPRRVVSSQRSSNTGGEWDCEQRGYTR